MIPSDLVFEGRWDDPNLPTTAADFVRGVYEKNRALLAARAQAPQSDRTASETGTKEFSLRADEMPVNELDAKGFDHLFKTNAFIRQLLSPQMAETDDSALMAAILTRRILLGQAQRMAHRLLVFVTLDRSCHPERPQQIEAEDCFNYDGDKTTLRDEFEALALFAALTNVLHGSRPQNESFQRALSIFRDVGDIYYDTLQTVFPNVTDVMTCRRAFSRLMRTFGTPAGCEAATDFVRATHALYRALVASRRGGAVAPTDGKVVRELIEQGFQGVSGQLATLTQAQQETTRAVENFDRRQTNFMDKLRRVLNTFLQLFRPGRKMPTQKELVDSFVGRYECLARVKNPSHYSQIKAVIDFTQDHPIDVDTRKQDAFTLSKAAEAVWNDHREEWAHLKGAFKKPKDLQSACQNIRNTAKVNPFRIKT